MHSYRYEQKISRVVLNTLSQNPVAPILKAMQIELLIRPQPLIVDPFLFLKENLQIASEADCG